MINLITIKTKRNKYKKIKINFTGLYLPESYRVNWVVWKIKQKKKRKEKRKEAMPTELEEGESMSSKQTSLFYIVRDISQLD